jgi:hypothetical protein
MCRTSLVLENDRLHGAADILAAEWWSFFHDAFWSQANLLLPSIRIVTWRSPSLFHHWIRGRPQLDACDRWGSHCAYTTLGFKTCLTPPGRGATAVVDI